MTFSHGRIRNLSPILLLIATLGVATPQADASPIVSILLDPAKYGGLDQTDVEDLAAMLGHPEFEGCLCGPTAAVNSFVYLQNMFPNKYDNFLVQDDPDTDADAMVDTALNLALNFMNSAGGTFIEDFIFGKQSYIDSVAPNSTRLAAQIGLEWNTVRTDDGDDSDEPLTAPGNSNIAKPNYVKDQTAPKLGFIASQLRKGEDVEIFVNNDFAHYLTVTGISFNRKTKVGTLHFIDPDDGMAHSSAITGLNMDGFIALDYSGGSTISHAVSESVPEPSALLLLGLGSVTLLRWRRNHPRRG